MKLDEKSRKHIVILNREMGEVKTDLAWMKSEIKDVKDNIEKVDTRTWYILGTVILGIAIQILFQLVKL